MHLEEMVLELHDWRCQKGHLVVISGFCVPFLIECLFVAKSVDL